MSTALQVDFFVPSQVAMFLEAAESTEMCLVATGDEAAVQHYDDFWVWTFLFMLLALWIMAVLVGYSALQKIHNILQNNIDVCWNKLTDAEWNIYSCWHELEQHDVIQQLESRVTGDHTRLLLLDSYVAKTAEDVMTARCYVNGLHDSVVQLGGYLRYPFGLEPNQQISMGIREHANVQNTMGAGQVEGGEATERAHAHHHDEGSPERMMMSHNNATITEERSDVIAELKVEWQKAVERGNINDARHMQHLIVQLLEEAVCNAVALPEDPSTRAANMFLSLATNARYQNRHQSSLYYGRREAHFRGEA